MYSVIRGMKALFTGQVIEVIKCDLTSGHIAMGTVEKRVQSDFHACRAVIELTNPSPIGKILFELIPLSGQMR